MIVIDKVVGFVKNNKIAQFSLVFIAGLALGAIFYPSKHIEEKLKKTYEQQITQLKQQHSEELANSQKTLDETKQQFAQYKSDSEDKIDELKTQVNDLKNKTKVDYYKIVRPDGTVEVHRVTESETEDQSSVITKVQEDYKQQIDTLQKQWEEAHQKEIENLKKTWDDKEDTYKKQLQTLEQSKVVDTNKRNFGIGAGFMSDMDVTINVSYDVVGPLFIFVQGDIPVVPTAGPLAVGGGLGLRF